MTEYAPWTTRTWQPARRSPRRRARNRWPPDRLRRASRCRPKARARQPRRAPPQRGSAARAPRPRPRDDAGSAAEHVARNAGKPGRGRPSSDSRQEPPTRQALDRGSRRRSPSSKPSGPERAPATSHAGSAAPENIRASAASTVSSAATGPDISASTRGAPRASPDRCAPRAAPGRGVCIGPEHELKPSGLEPVAAPRSRGPASAHRFGRERVAHPLGGESLEPRGGAAEPRLTEQRRDRLRPRGFDERTEQLGDPVAEPLLVAQRRS